MIVMSNNLEDKFVKSDMNLRVIIVAPPSVLVGLSTLGEGSGVRAPPGVISQWHRPRYRSARQLAVWPARKLLRWSRTLPATSRRYSARSL